MKFIKHLLTTAAIAGSVSASAQAQDINWIGAAIDPLDWTLSDNWSAAPTATSRFIFGAGDSATGDTSITTSGFMDIFDDGEVTWAENDLTVGTMNIANGGGTLNVTGGNVTATASTKFGVSDTTTTNVNLTGGVYSTTGGTVAIGDAAGALVNMEISGSATFDTTRNWILATGAGTIVNMNVSGEDFAITQQKNRDFRPGGAASFFNLSLELGPTGFGLFSIGDWDKQAGVTNSLTVDANGYLGTSDVLLIAGGDNNLTGFFDNTTILGSGFTEIRAGADGQDLYFVSTAVPEPGTLALMGLGTLALVIMRHRRRK